MKNYLEFEKEIKALEQEVDDLKSPFGSEGISEVDTKKIKDTQIQINDKLKETYANLNSWQRTQVARHEDRPKVNYYIKKIFSQFTLLSGDRYFGDDKSVIAGFGMIDKNIYAAGCYNGSGIGVGTLFGEQIAIMASNQQSNEIEIINKRIEPNRLPPDPILNVGIKARLFYERIRARSEV